MGERYLVDTCAVIKYLTEVFPKKGLQFMDKALNEESIISFVTEIELLVWNPPNPLDLKIYEDFVNDSSIISVDKDIVDNTIRIRKNYTQKLADSVIAATAIAKNFTLISDNDNDFLKVPNLKYLNPNKI